MPSMSSKEFFAKWNHELERDFERDGQPASWAVGQLQLWGSEPINLHFPQPFNNIALSIDESLLAVASSRNVHTYNATTFQPLHTFSTINDISTVHFDPTNRTIVVSGGRPSTISLIDIDQDASRPQSDVISVAATGAASAAISVLVEQGHWSKDDISAVDLAEKIKPILVDAQTSRDVNQGRAFRGSVASYASYPFNHDGSILFYVKDDRKTIIALDVAERVERFVLAGHTDSVMWFGLSPDEKLIGSSSWDKTVRLWDANDGSAVKTLTGAENQSWGGSFSPDGKLIAAGCGDKTARIWSVETGELLHSLQGFSQWARRLSFSPDGSQIIVGGGCGTVRVFKTASGECVQHWQIKLSTPFSASFTEVSQVLYRGTRVAIRCSDKRIVVYDVERNVKWEFSYDPAARPLEFHHAANILSTADGSRIISADSDGYVRMWKLD